MALNQHTSSLFLTLIIAIVAGAAAHSSFSDDNPIRQVVSEGLRDFEASVLQVIGNTRHALHFARFAHRYGKRYETTEEMRRRFSIFSESLKMIRSHNKKNLPYTLGVNRFADLTWEEFSREKLGAAQNCSATLKGSHKLTDVVLPEKKDWREEGIVSPVKDQGGCGSCWTFSTTGALEAAYTQAYGKGISLSEQQLVDCAQSFNNYGCNGGLPSQAIEYIKYNGGLETEASYPYTGKDGKCKFSSENVGVQVLDSVNITLYYGGTNYGRTSSSFVTTRYYDEDPLDEYGLLREPKWGHLRDVHRALRLSKKALFCGQRSSKRISKHVEIVTYEKPGDASMCAAFLINNHTKLPRTINFRGLSYYVPSKSISILPDCKTVLFNSQTIIAQHSTRNFVPSRKASKFRWESYPETIPTYNQLPIKDIVPRELYQLTTDASDYAWYSTRFSSHAAAGISHFVVV